MNFYLKVTLILLIMASAMQNFCAESTNKKQEKLSEKHYVAHVVAHATASITLVYAIYNDKHFNLSKTLCLLFTHAYVTYKTPQWIDTYILKKENKRSKNKIFGFF